MQGEKYDSSLEGIGYHFRINKDKTADIEKKILRKNKPIFPILNTKIT